MTTIPSRSQWVKSLWLSDAIWWQRFGWTLAQVMACCLTAPSHYLDQCWLIISKVEWHSSKVKFTRDTSAIDHWNYLENLLPKSSITFPRAQWVNMRNHYREALQLQTVLRETDLWRQGGGNNMAPGHLQLLLSVQQEDRNWHVILYMMDDIFHILNNLDCHDFLKSRHLNKLPPKYEVELHIVYTMS